MITPSRIALMVGTVLAGATLLCPLCDSGIRIASAQGTRLADQIPDTARVRLHISRIAARS